MMSSAPLLAAWVRAFWRSWAVATWKSTARAIQVALSITSRVAVSLSIALIAMVSFDSAFAAGDGTLVVLRNPTNSAPRVISTWGGAENQIVLKSDGTVWQWGFNGSGQLGNGTTNNTPVPIQVV